MYEQAMSITHTAAHYTGLPDPVDEQSSSFEDMLRSIVNVYSVTEVSGFTPKERFFSPSPTDSPFPLSEKLGMDQNSITFGSLESLEQRTKMVKKAVEKVAANLRKADAANTEKNVGEDEQPPGQ